MFIRQVDADDIFNRLYGILHKVAFEIGVFKQRRYRVHYRSRVEAVIAGKRREDAGEEVGVYSARLGPGFSLAAVGQAAHQRHDHISVQTGVFSGGLVRLIHLVRLIYLVRLVHLVGLARAAHACQFANLAHQNRWVYNARSRAGGLFVTRGQMAYKRHNRRRVNMPRRITALLAVRLTH